MAGLVPAIRVLAPKIVAPKILALKKGRKDVDALTSPGTTERLC
jgi:hypothetical protein